MKINKHAQLAVKWANGQWTYYRVSPHRKWASIMSYFKRLDNFRFAILYEYDKVNKIRANQIGYFDKQKDSFCG